MTNKQIQDYMHTIVSGLKAAGGGRTKQGQEARNPGAECCERG